MATHAQRMGWMRTQCGKRMDLRSTGLDSQSKLAQML